METSVEIRRSKLLPKLFALVFLYVTLCVGSNVVYGGRCGNDWASLYACIGGNRRSLPDDMTEPRGDVADWKRFPSKSTSLEQAERSSRMEDVRDLDAIKRQTKNLDDVFIDGDSFGDRFATRQQPKFSDVSEMVKSLGQRSVDGSMAQPSYNAGYEWAARTPWFVAKRLASTAAGWKRSLASNDVGLNAAMSKVKELMARIQLLEKWLMQVDEDENDRR